jgi:hypothetical protein
VKANRQPQPAPRKKPSRFPIELTTDRVIIGGTIILIVVIVGVIAISTGQNASNQNINIQGVEFFPGLIAEHRTTLVKYEQTPPVGGPHHPVWQTCGVYTEPISNEHAVHSLEHGAVWITYQPSLPADQVQTLQDITRRGTHRLLSPYPGIDSPIILSAWGYQLRVNDASDARINQFILKYEQGPSTPELGATCTGGETRPLSQLPAGL